MISHWLHKFQCSLEGHRFEKTGEIVTEDTAYMPDYADNEEYDQFWVWKCKRCGNIEHRFFRTRSYEELRAEEEAIVRALTGNK